MAYSYLMVMGGFVVFLSQVLRTRGHVRGQALIMMAGSALPLISNVLYFLGPGAVLYLDWTPVSFAVSGIFFYIGLFRFRMLDLMPIAREQIITSMEDGMVITDPEGYILEVNRATEKLLEQGNVASTGRNITHLLPFLAPAWESSLDRDPVEMELPRHVDGARRWMTVRMRHVMDEAGVLQGKMVLLRDVTERKEAEIHLMESRKRIQELSALKSAFLSNMSHDVRTPLSGIIGLADVLVEETEGDHQELAGMIKTSGERLLKLQNSILSVSHLASGTLDQNIEPTNVAALAHGVLVEHQREAEEKGFLMKNNGTDAVIVRNVDPAHIAHAIRYTEREASRWIFAKEITI